MTRRFASRFVVAATTLASPLAAQTAAPSAPAATAIDEIVVTANRREERLQDVGISIAAFTGAQLQSLGVATAGDVAQITPNFEAVRSYAAPGFNTQFTIRGVGQPDFQDTTEATTTAYVDNFYLIGAGQADFLAFDIARVEVARGPQGTVQGRNATAGSVNFYTNQPSLDSVSGKLTVGLGEHGLVKTDGFLNVPLGPKAALRAAFATDHNNGYLKNINPSPLWTRGGANKFVAGRIQLLLEPTETLKVVLKAEIGEMGPVTAQNEKAYPTGPIAGRVGTFRVPTDAFGQNQQNIGAGPTDLTNSDGPYLIGHKLQHYLATVNWEANDALAVTWITGYLKSTKFEVEDCDHTPLPICLFSNSSRSEHWSSELRGNYTHENFRLTAGANYLDHIIRTESSTPLFFNAAISPFPGGLYVQAFRDNQDLRSFAFFGQGEYDFAEHFTIIAGLRYTHDNKTIDSLNGVRTTFPLTTPAPGSIEQFLALKDQVFALPDRITVLNPAINGDLARFRKGLVNANLELNYQPTSDLLLYAAYRRGVKSGGFISGNVDGTPAALRKFNEETNNAFEVGAKSTLAHGLVRLNGAFFYYDYRGMQNTSLIGITNVITNNNAKIYGGELELTARPATGLIVSGGIGLINTKVYGIYNPTGAVAALLDNRLPLAPSFSGNFNVRYETDALNGKVYVQGSGRGRTYMFRDSLNNQSTRIPGLFVADAQIGYDAPDNRWGASLYVKNVFNTRSIVNAFDLSGVGNSGEVVYQMPRWFGGSFTIRL